MGNVLIRQSASRPASSQTLIPRKYLSWETFFAVLILGLIAFLMIAPFVWFVQVAFTPLSDAFEKPLRWLPLNPTLDNFRTLFEGLPFLKFALNSLKVTGIVTAGQLVLCSSAAFAFAKLNFPGRDILFLLLVSALMIPVQVTIIPLFLLMREIGLYNTHWALILPGLINPLGVFLVRQYMYSIPNELMEAARIDGASTFRIYRSIFVPLITPALATLAILSFINWWNEYLLPLVMINDRDSQLLTVGLTLLKGQWGNSQIGPIAAGITFAVVPVLVIFLLLQRYIIKSVVTSGLK